MKASVSMEASVPPLPGVVEQQGGIECSAALESAVVAIGPACSAVRYTAQVTQGDSICPEL